MVSLYKAFTMAIGISLLSGAAASKEHRFFARGEACSFIGEVCHQALVAYARNPILVATIGELLFDANEKVKRLRLSRCDRHHAGAAIGRIAGGHVVAVARNPSLRPRFEIIVEHCEAALEGAQRGRMDFDVEALLDELEAESQ